MPHRILSHTADTGVEARSPDLLALVVDLATGMFESMASAPAGVTVDRTIEVEASGTNRADLVVEILSDLLYVSDVDDVFLCDFAATSADGDGVKVTAGTIPFAEVEVHGPPVKAVTYHDLTVEETPGGWYGRVYFDV